MKNNTIMMIIFPDLYFILVPIKFLSRDIKTVSIFLVIRIITLYFRTLGGINTVSKN